MSDSEDDSGPELKGEVGKVDILGYPVHYEKFGTGPEILLLIPGAIGTGRTDWMPQLKGPHAFDLQKYTIICIELPGWGRSRPPERKYDKTVYLVDAVCAIKLMDSLGYKSYSVIGWSDGAKVALVMSFKAVTKIKCVVIIGIFIKVTQETVKPTLSTENTKTWPKEMRNNYLQIYDEETLQKLWSGYIGFCKVFVNAFPGGQWTNSLQEVRCPVLIFHGDLDPLCSVEHALIVEKQIPYSQLHRFPRGTHNCHQKYAGEFKRITEAFFKEAMNYH